MPLPRDDQWVVQWIDVEGARHESPYDTGYEARTKERRVRDSAEWDGVHIHVQEPKRPKKNK